MPTITCIQCGADKHYSPSTLARIAGKYCSKTCEGLARRLRVTLDCAHCGQAFDRRRDQVKERNYCSPACSAEGRKKASIWGAVPDVEARRAYHRAYLEANRARIYQRVAAWAKRNRSARNVMQQNRRAGGELTRVEWESVLAAHDGRCAACGTAERIEMDHIVPISRGGKTVIDNVQPLCRACNASKGAREATFPIRETC